jgi:hypothetical protein
MSEEQEKELLKQCKEISFHGDVDSLSASVDKALELLVIAQDREYDLNLFEIKVRTGIMRLKKLGAEKEAQFYTQEIMRMKWTEGNKEKFRNYALIFSLLFLALIAIFGPLVLNENFRVYKKVIDYVSKLFQTG